MARVIVLRWFLVVRSYCMEIFIMSDSLREIFQKRQSRATKVFIIGALIFSCLAGALGVQFVHGRKVTFSENLILEYVESQSARELAIAEAKIDESEPFPYPEELYNSLEQYYSAVKHSQEMVDKGFQFSEYIWFFGLCSFVIFLASLMIVMPVVVGGRSLMKYFICPHCLKSISVKDLDFSCPACGKEHHGSENDLFYWCYDCKKKIPAVDCSHCGKSIDLFAPYDLKA